MSNWSTCTKMNWTGTICTLWMHTNNFDHIQNILQVFSAQSKMSVYWIKITFYHIQNDLYTNIFWIYEIVFEHIQ